MIDKTVFLFPGQGSQFVGMGADLISSDPDARARVDEACDLLGFDIGHLILEGPEDKLQLTYNTQPAILLVSVIALEALKKRYDITPIATAGHSLGEFSACVAGGVIKFADAIRLVRRRGELMQSAVPVGEGAMAAIIGLDSEAVTSLCKQAGDGVSPANFNSPEQTVIAGTITAVEKAMEIAKGNGAKRAIRLPVSAPFHSPFMQSAAVGLAQFMEKIEFSDPAIPVVRNVDAGASTTADEVREGVIKQVTGCVRWVDSMKTLAGMGMSLAIEIGPGKVLGGLLKRIDKSVKTVQMGSMDDIDKIAEVING